MTNYKLGARYDQFVSKNGGDEERRRVGEEDRRIGGQENRRTGGQEDRRTEESKFFHHSTTNDQLQIRSQI